MKRYLVPKNCPHPTPLLTPSRQNSVADTLDNIPREKEKEMKTIATGQIAPLTVTAWKEPKGKR